MAATLHSDVYDSGLSVLDTATSILHICSTQPTTLAEATTTYKLGTKTSLSIGAPQAHTTGRKVVVAAFSDGSVTATGSAAYFGIVDGTRLLAAGPLASSQSVTIGNTFSLAAFDIALPAPV